VPTAVLTFDCYRRQRTYRTLSIGCFGRLPCCRTQVGHASQVGLSSVAPDIVELVHAVVDALEILVDVGPGHLRCTGGRHIGRGRRLQKFLQHAKNR